jgi:hypothetical protein
MEAAHAQIGGGGGLCRRGSEHLGAFVDAEQLRLWVEVENAAGRLPRADAELECALGADTGGRLGDGVL